MPFFFYIHDHLFSPAALVHTSGTVLERYEYDAYGNCYVMDASYNPRTKSSYGNPFYFTGREMDIFDSGNLKVYNYRHRYYDSYTGRFTTHDPLGITPSPKRQIRFELFEQYSDGLCLYTYVSDSPVIGFDPDGKSWDCVPGARLAICRWRLRHRSFPGMRVAHYAHCWPTVPPSIRTESDIDECRICISQYQLDRAKELWKGTLETSLAEGVATGCLIATKVPILIGGGVVIVVDGVGTLSCLLDISRIMNESANKAKSACGGDFREILRDLDKDFQLGER